MDFNIINNMLIQCYKMNLFIEKFQVENDKAHPDFSQYLPFLLELVDWVFRSHSLASTIYLFWNTSLLILLYQYRLLTQLHQGIFSHHRRLRPNHLHLSFLLLFTSSSSYTIVDDGSLLKFVLNISIVKPSQQLITCILLMPEASLIFS